jgi:hypothetical protein
MEAEPSPAPESTASEFTRLLEYLKASRGFDFGSYKVSTLMRRVQKRMREVGAQTYGQYSDYLEVHPNEFGPLFDTVLINVTAFFRDPQSWEFLRAQILPRIVREKEPDAPIRIWSAGCASGEEAYTLAMLMTEAVGEESFRQRVKIYATDADEEALIVARQGTYNDRDVAGIPPEVFRDVRQLRHPPGVPQRAAPLPDLRPARPDPGRGDLPPGPAGVPQHADVLQRGGAGPDPRPLPLRREQDGVPVPGEGGDPALPQQQLQAGVAQAQDLLADLDEQPARPSAGVGAGIGED